MDRGKRHPLLALAVLLGVLAGTRPEVTAAEESSELRLAGRRAPVLSGQWLDGRPMRRADLDDKVVLVEFWTFDCINCRRTVPAMKRLHALFAGGGDVVVVGVHTPETAHERDPRAVRRAVARLQLPYPVLLDPEMANWKAYDNHYWPALYVIDRRGTIRDLHIGELHEGTLAWRSLVTLIERLRREPA